ncbi:MAG TPA: hypothetical protein VKZ55_07780 [Microthrixaceae bacterium]|jgi:hypothetical protein|nr:hypothetical protein [Microthrixaceae bacterium]
MSRTLVHRPPRAWFDHPAACVPHHDHTEGPCDLPTLAEWHAWAARGGRDQPWRCGWELNWERLPNLCGCRLCTGHHWFREARRRDRQRTRIWLATGAWTEEWIDPTPRR